MRVIASLPLLLSCLPGRNGTGLTGPDPLDWAAGWRKMSGTRRNRSARPGGEAPPKPVPSRDETGPRAGQFSLDVDLAAVDVQRLTGDKVAVGRRQIKQGPHQIFGQHLALDRP